MRRLRAHQDPDLLELLPLAVEREQRADLEVAGGDVERLRDAGPLLEVAEAGPAGDAVVDDEEVAAFATWFIRFGSSARGHEPLEAKSRRWRHAPLQTKARTRP